MNKEDKIIIANGNVFLPEGHFEKADILIENGVISEVCGNRSNAWNYVNQIDASDLYVIPGLIDIHTHGALGCDFSSGREEELLEFARYERTKGITSFCPTSMSLEKEKLKEVFLNASKIAILQRKVNSTDADTADVIGINMEGPFINPDRAGAQIKSNIIPADVELFTELNQICKGLIKLVTIAPEIEGADEFIDALSGGVTISLGHTNSDYNTSIRAFEKGVNHVTHLFNAMPGLGHREPGLIGAAAENKNVYAEIICDGVHIHPSSIRAAFDMFGDEHLIFISDSMAACGMDDGEYELGGQKVVKKGKAATLADGTLAGSASDLFDCFLNAIEYGIPLESAIKCVTLNPAKSIGMSDRIGVIKKEAKADLLLLDKNLNLVKVI